MVQIIISFVKSHNIVLMMLVYYIILNVNVETYN